MSAWTQRDMPDLSGRIAVVTGGNVGSGLLYVTKAAPKFSEPGGGVHIPA